ncbi:MAG: DUF2797 domain-containing protein [Candidatus Gracilibacteria bacterium]|nr:DUF2797 domain-containing protein [Candidatus Gracilibacteria bacterium]
MKVLLYDFRWNDPETCQFEGAGVTDNFANKFGVKPIQIGNPLSLEICSEVRCAGSREHGRWKPCPKQATGKPKCDYCRAIEGNFVYTAFDGFDQSQLQPGDLEKIAGKHLVYLALFEKDLIKVGVCKSERKELRQLEQGSHATLFVAEAPDGIAARQIESLLRKTGLGDKIKSSEKKDLLLPSVSCSEAEKILRTLLAEKKELISTEEHLKSFWKSEPEFCCWEPLYQTGKLPTSPLMIQLEKGDWLSGTLVAKKGPFLVLEAASDLVALDTKYLRGREVDFTPRPAGLQTSRVLQNALF